MTTSEIKLKQLLCANVEVPTQTTKDDIISMDHFRQWFLQQFKETNSLTCDSLDNFAIYFLNTMRQQTEKYLRTNEIEQTCQTPVKTSKLITNNSDIDGYEKKIAFNTPKRVSLYPQNSAPTTPNFASTPEQVNKSKGYFECSLLTDTSSNYRNNGKDISSTVSTPAHSMERSLTSTYKSDASTPMRRNQNSNRRSGNSSLLPVTPHSTEKSVRSNSATSSFCLGDFMVLQQNNNRSNRKKATSTQIQNTATSSCNETPTNSKPKKRVVPTTISNRSVVGAAGELKAFGCNSSFSNDNNILKLSNAEIEDKNKCSIMAARKSLKLNAVVISKEMEITSIGEEEKNLREMVKRKLRDVTLNVETETTKATLKAQPPIVELEKIKNHAYIQRLADIYVVLMDLNFVTNILSEMAFMVNLLNTQETTLDDLEVYTSEGTNIKCTSIEEESIGIQMLSNVTNCIYFALCVIRRQRHLFAHLDIKSLGVVLHNERIHCLDTDLKLYLESIYHLKQNLHQDKSQAFETSTTIERSFKSVYYQEDKDSRQHFTSNNEFGAFKTQRDLFYKVLKLWETHHLNPNWNYTQELAPRIREIFKQSENSINMAHFAKLFVSQLLISASDATSPEDIGLDVDAEKFSKLAQRLVAPSNFSVDYQFPRNQAFFRDFIAEARSIPFTEQLKMALYFQLITLNNSTFEQTNLLTDNKDADELETDNDKAECGEFIVRAETLASMIILAKFLGFVTAYPYSQHLHTATISGSIEKKQLLLRGLFKPHFNVSHHLLEAIKYNKMLITLPWLVQYLAMLDNVTLQLSDFAETTQLLFALYTTIGCNSTPRSLTATSIFILRCCMGWLFDTKPFIAENYFRYRTTQTTTNIGTRTHDETHAEHVEPEKLIVGILGATHDSSNVAGSKHVSVPNDNNICKEITLNPLLESLLTVACPFLAEFRVAIMPSKYATTKLASRTGRYRHITTRIAEPQSLAVNSPSHIACNTDTNVINSQRVQQNKLIEAFLHSQNPSMRRLIEFVTERVYKSVVKDGQHKYILPTKATADKRVNEITSSNIDEVYKIVSNNYISAYDEVHLLWESNIPKLLDERIAIALAALLPTETTPIVQKTYSQLIRQNAMKRVKQWFLDNVQPTSFYCGDLNEITQKICKANKKKQQSSSTSELKIVSFKPSVSDLLDELQYWLHCTSLRPELLIAGSEEIVAFLQRIPKAFVNTLPTIFYRLIGAGVIQIIQQLIIHKPSCVTIELMESACTILLHPNFIALTNTTERSKNNNNQSNAQSVNNVSDDESTSTSSTDMNRTPNIYDALITVAFIEALGDNSDLFGKLKDLLVYMITQQVLTIDKVNALFIPIFKENWPINVLNEISKTLQRIADDTAKIGRTKRPDIADDGESSEDEAKSHLFMEVLADLSRDVDNLDFY
ncbi:protein disks lost [Bactrocera oleae]|uniref:protein disks lost n=1 Tax=Bactrocera oleae TaxID=104688 RepID=UPI00387E49F9